jgi:predicted unusual protein kinase regulating ubiquinone biosynthesis (AarF/ABC1/UbiB family)
VNLRSYWRFLVVAWQFAPLLLSYARDRRRFLFFGGPREVSSERRRRRASTLLDSLLTLGPTFIKLGQLLSTRPDILPPEYIAEFVKLQDRVPAADWAEARTVVETELGPVEEAFDSFETEPISGASLGQVYEAEVDGQRVAVKVRRPGVKDLVEADLRVVRWSVPILQRFVDEARSFSLETLADEFAETIRQEMNYEREGQMLREIRANFADREGIRIPAVVESQSTRRVLTMEYVGGTKITDLDRLEELGIDRSTLAERLQRAYLKMIIDDGVFHADPHPGNLAVRDDGTLVFYDFGMSAYVDPFIQERLSDFYGAVVRQDIDAILDALVEMGTLSPRADRDLMADIMELAITDLQGGDIDDYRIQQIVNRVEDTIYEFPLRLPANLALVLRVATVVEGVCVTLDPDFDFISVSTAYLTEEGYVEQSIRTYVRDRGADLRAAAVSAVQVPSKLESVLDTMERGNLQVAADLQDPEKHFRRLARRLVYGMTVAAGIVSTTVLFVAATPLAAGVGAVLTLLAGAFLYRSFQSGITLRAEPQFTRQRMRETDRQGGLADSLTDEGPPQFQIPLGEESAATGEKKETTDSEPTDSHDATGGASVPVTDETNTETDETESDSDELTGTGGGETGNERDGGDERESDKQGSDERGGDEGDERDEGDKRGSDERGGDDGKPGAPGQ